PDHSQYQRIHLHPQATLIPYTTLFRSWQQANFANPVAVTANTVYVASYHSTIGYWSANWNFFASSGVDNAPLHALANTSGTPDGRFTYGSSSAFPTSTNTANYWVDVAFSPNSGSGAVAPSITG